MIVQLNPSALRETHWYEYLIRFALGGAVTVVAGLIAARFGPVVGGLFLAFPAIFPASATLIEKEREGGVIRGPPRQASGCVGCRGGRTRKLGAGGFRCRYLAADRAVSGFGSRPCDGGMAHGCGACLDSAAMALTETL
jgi:Protein of unknown function (DUF3147)